MNEPLQDLGEERPAAPGLRDMGARLVVSVLGPNEELALPRFMPYAPQFNLRPLRKGLPLWTLPLIAGVAALLFVVPVAAGVQLLTAHTEGEIESAKRKTEMRIKEAAQYDAAQKRLESIVAEKEALDKVAGTGPRWSVLLDRVRDQLPPGVRLTLIQADARGKVMIEGETQDIRSLGRFMVYLRAYRDPGERSFFERPKLVYTERPQRVPGMYVPSSRIYTFQMSLRVPAASLAELDDTEGGRAEEGAELGRTSGATVSIPAPPEAAGGPE